MIETRFGIGEVPNNVIQTGPEMVNHFASENTETQWDALIPVIRDGLLPNLVIWMGDNWVLPTLNKDSDLGLQVDDVLIGPL
jgi:hypothetical protein